MDDLQLFLSGRADRLLLKILAKIHAATNKQLRAFLKLANPNETEDALDNCFNRLINLGLLSVKTYRISSGLGQVRTRAGCPVVLTEVYYLTKAGVDNAEIVYKGVGRYARSGEPTGVHEDRIYHDLLICEAFLDACSTYSVTNFVTEAELKSEIFRARGVHKTAENTGDFRVDYINHLGAADCFTGEVILQSKTQQLEGKPKNIVFFTDCVQTADRVQECKNTGAFILKNVLENEEKNVENNQKTEENSAENSQVFTNLEVKILQLLEQTPIGIDAETVGIILKIHRANASSALSDLARKNVICYQFLKVSDGRPLKLYAAKTVKNFDDFLTRKLFYSSCLLLRLIAKNNSIVERFNLENNTVTAANSLGKRMLILIDSIGNSVRDNVVEFNILRSVNTQNVDGMKMFVADSTRFKCAGKLLTHNFLLKPANQ